MAGVGGGARIGNRASVCRTCNRWNSAVRRMTGQRLKAAHEDEYESLRIQVEMDLFGSVIEDWNVRHPQLTAMDIELDGNGMAVSFNGD